MRKSLTILMMAVMIMTAAIVPAQAAVIPGEEIAPMAMYHHEANATLTISSSGMAEAKGQITGWIGTTTKCSITLYLQRYENGDWEDVAMWTDTANGSSLTLTRTLGVDSGYKYRAKAICYAYSGSQMEYVTRYSSEVYY
ncbi:MAG: hypothetical protein IJ987_01325 [Firmicutes bacterium]|nr:hypothetical protein [Bacillota bacterium]